MKPTCIGAIALTMILAGMNRADSQERPKRPAEPKPARAEKSDVDITISKQTTYITGPLRKDGYVNYVAALNRHLRLGVTPENNAAVPLLKAMGPGDIGPKYRDEYYRLLDIRPLPEKGDYFVPLDAYAKDWRLARSPIAGEAEKGRDYRMQLNLAMKRPWSKKEFPVVAGWLAANEKPLAWLIVASKRPRLYGPLSPEDGCVIEDLLPAYYREAAQGGLLGWLQVHDDAAHYDVAGWRYRWPLWALNAHAMLRVQEGKVDEAWADRLACHRLARLVGQGPTLGEAAAAGALDDMACFGDEGFLRHAHLTSAQIARMRADLDKLPSITNVVEITNVGERCIFLDSAGILARRGFSTMFCHDKENLTQGMIFALMDVGAKECIDWDQVLRMGNSWYDQVADAMSEPTRAERHTALDKIEGNRRRKLEASAKLMKSPCTFVPAGMRYASSHRLGHILMSLMPRMESCTDWIDRGSMQFELTRLAFALAAYRADRGTYPVTLAELAPSYIAEISKDIFTNSELHYRQEAGGYLLYSVGINGRDDGGKGYADRDRAMENVKNGEAFTPEDWDDLSVRIPGATAQQQ
jgi:hypothetical protein